MVDPRYAAAEMLPSAASIRAVWFACQPAEETDQILQVPANLGASELRQVVSAVLVAVIRHIMLLSAALGLGEAGCTI